MSAGRPTKYNRNMLKRTIEYIENHDGPIPSVAGLSLELNLSKSTIYLWAQEHEEFSYALERLKSKQEILLMQGGLTNKYNATIAKLIMATNHGYSDKQELTHQGNGGGPVEFIMVSPDAIPSED
jgi:L-rhamnose mutarotase